MMRFIEYTNKTMNEVYESLKNAWIRIREQWEDKNFEQSPGRMYGSCLRKRVYRTYNYALSEAERLGKQNGVELFVYWCPYCHNYHLTKTKQK